MYWRLPLLDLKIKSVRGLLEIEALDQTGKRIGTIYVKPEEVIANSMGEARTCPTVNEALAWIENRI
jgi:hypothetical protein